MFRRNHIPDFFYGGGQSDGWKWDYHKLMLLEVSMCLIVWFDDYGINYKPQIQCLENLFQANHKLRHLQKTVISTYGLKKENHCCTSARCRSFCRIVKKDLSHCSTKTPS